MTSLLQETPSPADFGFPGTKMLGGHRGSGSRPGDKVCPVCQRTKGPTLGPSSPRSVWSMHSPHLLFHTLLFSEVNHSIPLSPFSDRTLQVIHVQLTQVARSDPPRLAPANPEAP